MTLLKHFRTKESAHTGPPSFEAQLEQFQAMGFRLNEGVTKSDLLQYGKTAFEKKPYSWMYSTLGLTLGRKPWTPITDRCWNFDTEAITGNGSYIAIVNNLERISRGVLAFENVRDHVDFNQGNAWVSLTFEGLEYVWNLRVSEHWADSDFISDILSLAEKSNTNGRYTYYLTGDQNVIIGFETPETLEALKKKTGLLIKWV